MPKTNVRTRSGPYISTDLQAATTAGGRPDIMPLDPETRGRVGKASTAVPCTIKIYLTGDNGGFGATFGRGLFRTNLIERSVNMIIMQYYYIDPLSFNVAVKY